VTDRTGPAGASIERTNTLMAAPFLLDCDTGIDDSLAILYLLSDPAVDLVAITTVSGNVTADQAAYNTQRLLTLAGRSDIPVSVGARDPLARPFDGGAPHVHGVDGVGSVALPEPSAPRSPDSAVDTIVRSAHAHPGALNLVAIGPLTNIALALRAEPRLPELVKSITIMGGAALAPGNISPVAEANIGNDPEAAAEVFKAAWTVTMVPLDVTMQNLLEEPDRLALLASDRPVARTIGKMLERYFAFYATQFGRPCCALHDPLAIAIATGSITAAIRPQIRAEVDDSSGPGRGQTICDLRGKYSDYPDDPRANCDLVLELDEPFAPVMMDRLLSF
jgi:purine nucleosidase